MIIQGVYTSMEVTWHIHGIITYVYTRLYKHRFQCTQMNCGNMTSNSEIARKNKHKHVQAYQLQTVTKTMYGFQKIQSATVAQSYIRVLEGAQACINVGTILFISTQKTKSSKEEQVISLAFRCL